MASSASPPHFPPFTIHIAYGVETALNVVAHFGVVGYAPEAEPNVARVPVALYARQSTNSPSSLELIRQPRNRQVEAA
jgi:hypothetical protein